MRVALITNIPAPYRYPTWNALAEQVEHLTVFLCAVKEANRIWNTDRLHDYRFTARVLPGRSWYVPQRDWGVHWNPTLLRELAAMKPTHIIVTGYDVPSYWLAIGYAKRHRIPLTIWWGSHALSSRSSSGLISFIRKTLLRQGDTYVTYGEMATEFLAGLGIPRQRIQTGTNSVDVAALCKAVDQHAPLHRSPGPVRFLYVGQFIERKGVRPLLEAFARLPEDQVHLTLVGYGPQEQELKAYALHHCGGNVTFAGATRSLEETARYYANADVFVMPSHTEVWGLVVNEALAAGLFVLSSRYAGATPDLITGAPLPVGFSIDPENVGTIEAAMREVIPLVQGGQITRADITRWGRSHSPENYARAIYGALRAGDQQ